MRRTIACLVASVLLIAFAASASAAPKTSLSDIEDEVMCPTCGTALSLSESPLAQRQRALIQRLVDEGKTKDEIKARLVAEFGPEVLALPPREGFSLAAYVVPAIAFLGALVAALVTLTRRRARSAPPGTGAPGGGFDDLVDADLLGIASGREKGTGPSASAGEPQA